MRKVKVLQVPSSKLRLVLGKQQRITEIRRNEGKVIVELMRSWLRGQRT